MSSLPVFQRCIPEGPWLLPSLIQIQHLSANLPQVDPDSSFTSIIFTCEPETRSLLINIMEAI